MVNTRNCNWANLSSFNDSDGFDQEIQKELSSSEQYNHVDPIPQNDPGSNPGVSETVP